MERVTDTFRASQETLEVGGRERTLTLVVPDSAGPRPPLLLLFHGSQQSSRVFRKFTGGTFDALAARTGTVLAYPDGVGHHFNDARAGADFECRRLGVDDVAFAAALVDRLADRLTDRPAGPRGIDRDRVFAAGYSNGGQMVLRLMNDAPELLAGAATFAATQPAPSNFAPGRPDAPPHPLPYLAVHGTADPLAPYDGGHASLWGAQSRGEVLSAPESATYFARRNGLDDEAALSRPAPGVLLNAWEEPGKPPVRLWSVEGMGHVVPSARQFPESLGPTTDAFVGADLVGEFFGLEQRG